MTKDALDAPRPTRVVRPDAAAIEEAARLIREGRLVAMPTETVYGLAADGTDDRAVAALYAAKGRPSFNPLIAHVGGLDEAEREAEFDEHARRLAERFWPGPLTLVAPVASTGRVSLLARAGLDTVALRAPAHDVAQGLIAAAGRPLVAPSANRSGHVSATSAAHVLADLDGRIDLILDAGPSRLGVESTIVACLGGVPRLLRPGALAKEAIEAALGFPLAAPERTSAPAAPGMLASHYAPAAPVRLGASSLRAGEAGLDFGATFGPGDGPVLDLSPRGDLVEAAAHLFAHLRALDAMRPAAIAVAPIPSTGLGLALNDRLARAAAERR